MGRANQETFFWLRTDGTSAWWEGIMPVLAWPL
jgi:hypothetical protein